MTTFFTFGFVDLTTNGEGDAVGKLALISSLIISIGVGGLGVVEAVVDGGRNGFLVIRVKGFFFLRLLRPPKGRMVIRGSSSNSAKFVGGTRVGVAVVLNGNTSGMSVWTLLSAINGSADGVLAPSTLTSSATSD